MNFVVRSVAIVCILILCRSSIVAQSVSDIKTTTRNGEPVGAEQISVWLEEGKTLAISFWSKRCPPCIKHLPRENALAERYKDRGFMWLWINVNEKPEEIPDGIWEKCPSMHVLFDVDGATLNAYDDPPWGPVYIVNAENGVLWYGSSFELCDTMLSRMLETRVGTPRKHAEVEKEGGNHKILVSSASQIGGSETGLETGITFQKSSNITHFLPWLAKCAYGDAIEIEMTNEPDCLTSYDFEVRTTDDGRTEQHFAEALNDLCEMFHVSIMVEETPKSKVRFDLAGMNDLPDE